MERTTQLDQLVREGVRQAHEQIRRLQAETKLISRHYDYPTLDQFDSGQPRISHGQGPTDYAGVFKLEGSDRWSVSFDEVPAFAELGQLALEDENLRARILVPGVTEITEWRERFVTIGAARVPLELLDRLLNTVGDDFTDADLDDAWRPLRNGLLWEKLPIEIAVPACLTTFDVRERVDLDEGIRLEPIPDDEQKARMPRTFWNAAAHDCVAAAATHAVSLTGYELPDGRNRMLLDYTRPAFYPVDKIELAFEALRIAGDAPFGYAQIYMRPLGWAWHYKADLPPVIGGAVARRYPPSWDEFAWLRPPEVMRADTVRDAGATLAALRAGPKTLRLASQRFSSATLRKAEDDAVLDLCIALEAALGDRQRSEMTYKLGLRSAAVLGFETDQPDEMPQLVNQIKRLYDWRSAIVHGDDTEKARRRFAGDEDQQNGLDVAQDLVQRVLRQLMRHPELRAPEFIDTNVLLGDRRPGDRPARTD